MAADLYVSGLDLSTGLVVQVEDREVWEWYRKGHNGDGTLVCLECYYGAGNPGEARTVPLVPRGRIGGVRRAHFAHPPGMAPVGGHSPETAWHWEVKHRLCRWANETAGSTARVEAWTADGRRRSDVAVTLPGGVQLAIEVQLGRITDTEILDRRDDYARAGTDVVWVWPQAGQIPHVLFKFGKPGWVFDQATDQLGLACGRAHAQRPTPGATVARIRSAHCPPCPGDDLETRWMRLADVQLTDSGLLPSPEIVADLEHEAAEAAARARDMEAAARQAPVTAASQFPARMYQAPASTPARPHLAIRIDALPPWSDTRARHYWCPQCGYLTGANLQDNPGSHEIPGPDRIITAADLDTGHDPKP